MEFRCDFVSSALDAARDSHDFLPGRSIYLQQHLVLRCFPPARRAGSGAATRSPGRWTPLHIRIPSKKLAPLARLLSRYFLCPKVCLTLSRAAGRQMTPAAGTTGTAVCLPDRQSCCCRQCARGHPFQGRSSRSVSPSTECGGFTRRNGCATRRDPGRPPAGYDRSGMVPGHSRVRCLDSHRTAA